MKRRNLVGGLLTLSVLSFAAFNFGLGQKAEAAADVCTWVGTANGSFSNAANWSGCDNGNVPENVDTIRFTSMPSNPNLTLTNDLGFELAGVSISAPNGSERADYTIDTLTLADSAIVNDNGANEVRVIVNNLTGQGDLSIASSQVGSGFKSGGTGSWNIAGGLTIINDSQFDYSFARIASVGSLTVRNGAIVTFTPTVENQSTGTFPITLGGGGGTNTPQLRFALKSGLGAMNWSFANPLTLMSNATASVYASADPSVVNQTGSITGPGFRFSMNTADSSANASLIIAPSSNNSATVAGTTTGTDTTGSGVGGTEEPATQAAAPATPDTGFAVMTKNPAITAAVAIVAAIGLGVIGRRLQVALEHKK